MQLFSFAMTSFPTMKPSAVNVIASASSSLDHRTLIGMSSQHQVYPRQGFAGGKHLDTVSIKGGLENSAVASRRRQGNLLSAPSASLSKIQKKTSSAKGGRRSLPRKREASSDSNNDTVAVGFYVKEQTKLLAYLYHTLDSINSDALKHFAESLVTAVCLRKRSCFPFGKESSSILA